MAEQNKMIMLEQYTILYKYKTCGPFGPIQNTLIVNRQLLFELQLV